MPCYVLIKQCNYRCSSYHHRHHHPCHYHPHWHSPRAIVSIIFIYSDKDTELVILFKKLVLGTVSRVLLNNDGFFIAAPHGDQCRPRFYMNKYLVRPQTNMVQIPIVAKTNTSSPIAKFMGRTWGPPGSFRPQMDPMLAPWTSFRPQMDPMLAPWTLLSWLFDVY